MVTIEQLITTISVIGAIVAIFVAIIGARRNGRRDLKDETTGLQEMRGDLKYTVRGIDDIRIDLRAQRDQLSDMGDRLARVEESSKSAHKRLDGLERNERKASE